MKENVVVNEMLNQALLLIFGALIYVNVAKFVFISPILVPLVIVYPLGVRYGWFCLYNHVDSLMKTNQVAKSVQAAYKKGRWLGHLTGLYVYVGMVTVNLTVYWIVGLKTAMKNMHSII